MAAGALSPRKKMKRFARVRRMRIRKNRLRRMMRPVSILVWEMLMQERGIGDRRINLKP
jgi:hypothetical protein